MVCCLEKKKYVFLHETSSNQSKSCRGCQRWAPKNWNMLRHRTLKSRSTGAHSSRWSPILANVQASFLRAFYYSDVFSMLSWNWRTVVQKKNILTLSECFTSFHPILPQTTPFSRNSRRNYYCPSFFKLKITFSKKYTRTLIWKAPVGTHISVGASVLSPISSQKDMTCWDTQHWHLQCIRPRQIAVPTFNGTNLFWNERRFSETIKLIWSKEILPLFARIKMCYTTSASRFSPVPLAVLVETKHNENFCLRFSYTAYRYHFRETYTQIQHHYYKREKANKYSLIQCISWFCSIRSRGTESCRLLCRRAFIFCDQRLAE